MRDLAAERRLVASDCVAGAAVLNPVEAAWLVGRLLDPVALGMGAAHATRFTVRPLALVLGGLAVATGAELVVDLRAGQPGIRSESTPHAESNPPREPTPAHRAVA